MDTGKVEVFLRAVELGSFSKAAKEYLYTPPAVAYIADSIEKEVGIKLIRRTFEGIEREAGVDDVFEALNELVATHKRITRLARERKKDSQVITIAAYSSFLKNVLSRLIGEFQKEFPSVDFNIIVNDKVREMYEKQEADIIFGEKFRNENLMWVELLDDDFIAVLPKTFPVSGDEVKREALSESTFIMAEETKISKYMENIPVRHMIHVSSQDDSSIVQMVKAGVGVSIIPELSISDKSGVSCVKLKPPLTRTLGLMYEKKSFKKNPGLRKFVDFTKKYINKAER